MKLFHGSSIGNITVLEPKQADHDRPYVYMTAIEVVALSIYAMVWKGPIIGFHTDLHKTAQFPFIMNCIRMP